jgi:endonuclease VIII
MRPVLQGHVPDGIRTPHPRHALDRWPERLAGKAVSEIRTHGKHLFLAFEGDLTIHSHLRMTGSWAVYDPGRRWRRSARRAWLVLERAGHEVVQFDGPVLELLTDSRTRFDQRLAALGPDILAETFDAERFLVRLRRDDPTRGIGDALLDQRNVAGIGNLWKSESCWDAAVDPWRPVSEVSDAEAIAVIEAAPAVRSRPRPAVVSSAGTANRALAAGRRSAPAARAMKTGRRSGVRAVSADGSAQATVTGRIVRRPAVVGVVMARGGDSAGLADDAAAAGPGEVDRRVEQPGAVVEAEDHAVLLQARGRGAQRQVGDGARAGDRHETLVLLRPVPQLHGHAQGRGKAERRHLAAHPQLASLARAARRADVDRRPQRA